MAGLIGLITAAAGCATGSSHPCLEAGDPPRDTETPFRGDRQCVQRKDPSGNYVNDGRYREWHPNGQLALEGMYRMGRKQGKWTLWDSQGRKIAEKYYEDGVEVSGPPSTADSPHSGDRN